MGRWAGATADVLVTRRERPAEGGWAEGGWAEGGWAGDGGWAGGGWAGDGGWAGGGWAGGRSSLATIPSSVIERMF